MEKCALILGPLASSEIGPDDHRRSLRSLLASELAETVYQKTGQSLSEPENLELVCTAFMQQHDASRTSLEIKVRDFYHRFKTPSPLIQMIAQLPFRFILTTSPDNLLQRAFSNQNKWFHDGHYRFSKTQTETSYDDKMSETYIYHLMGRVLDKPDGSLVLTQDDQLEYIDSMQGEVRNSQLPSSLRNAMKNFEAFFFLGFDYDDWFTRILFHIMKFPTTAKFFGVREDALAQLQPATEIYFRQQYKLLFFQNDPMQLLAGLHHHLFLDRSKSAQTLKTTRKLLFLYAESDEPIRRTLDNALFAVKQAHQLISTGIHDIMPGNRIDEARNVMIGEASVIVVILSADFYADEALVDATQHALAQQSEAVKVAAIYARSVAGVTDFFKGKAPVFPSINRSLNELPEGEGLRKVVEQLDKLISLML